MSILERLFDYKRKFQKQGIITLRHSELLSCSQVLSRQWLVKNEISKSVGKTKHREMYGKLLVLMTIRSNIMFSTYLCARVTKGTTQELWCPKRTGMETIKCKASWIILVTRIKEKAQVVLALSYSFYRMTLKEAWSLH